MSRFVKLLNRNYSTLSHKQVPQVCIVGAGPAGFYAAMHIKKNLPNVNIDFIEKLPVPFGLIRYGVAPDHPEVKNVINQFTKVAQQANVNFYGNVTLGKDVALKQLRQHYDAVLLTYGAEEDKLLGIENEDSGNVIAARSFVGWYNGLPSEKDLKVDLSGTTAAILGQGNVALDIARILLSPIDELQKTDITEHALNTLAESKVRELYLIGRRGPLQVAFTIKELREQLKLKNCRTIWKKEDFHDIDKIIKDLARPRKRLTELMLKSLNEMPNNSENGPDNRYFKPIFYRSPTKFFVDEWQRITGIQMQRNMLVGGQLDNPKIIPTDELEILNCTLAFRSIGYRSINVDDDLAFGNGIVKNNRGIVEDKYDNLAKVYVAGWLGTGPVGVILHTMGNAFQVAKLICEDLTRCDNKSKSGFEDIKHIITSSNEIVDWSGWERIDKYEVEQGKAKGKPREKICSIAKMLEIANAY